MKDEEVYKELTLDDIKTAISILQHFVKLSQEADRLLRQLSRYQRRYAGISGGNIFDVNEIVRAVLQQRYGGSGTATEETIGELTPEEIQRIKQIVNKVRKKTQP